jgi:hypothetical protein
MPSLCVTMICMMRLRAFVDLTAPVGGLCPGVSGEIFDFPRLFRPAAPVGVFCVESCGEDLDFAHLCYSGCTRGRLLHG